MEAEVTAWVQTFFATWAEGSAGYERGIAMVDDHADFAFAVDEVLWRSFPAVAEMADTPPASLCCLVRPAQVYVVIGVTLPTQRSGQ